MAKTKKINWKSKKTWKNVLIIGLACITLVGAIVGLSALFRKSEETTKVINPTYAIGGLTEQGKYKETDESIYTEDAFECQGLDIELDFRSNVSYRVFFYDGENDFISSTAKLTSNYDEETTPFLAKYARIVITPNEDEEIKWYEKNGYANQLTISVDKEQDYKYQTNLFAIESGSQGTYYSGALTETADGQDEYCRSTIVDVRDYSKLTLFVDNFHESLDTIVHFASGDSAKTIVSAVILDVENATLNGDYYVLTIDVPETAIYVSLSIPQSVNCLMFAE